jgi:hypothetical protein
MELQVINPSKIQTTEDIFEEVIEAEEIIQQQKHFIEANTSSISLKHLKMTVLYQSSRKIMNVP